MKNKKASLDIVIFVVMVLIICIYALVQIASYKNKFEFKLKGYENLEEIQLEKKDLEYRLEKYLEECVIMSYYSAKNDEIYEKKEIEGLLFFSRIKENLNETLNQKIKICLKEKGEKDYLNFFENYEKKPFLSVLLSRLKDNKFETKIDRQNIKIFIEDFPLTKPSDKEKKYKYNMSLDINLKKVGLIPFEEIEKIISCKKDTQCVEEITKNLFNVRIEEKEETRNNKKILYLIYKFASLREFYIEEKFQNIKFEIKVFDRIEEISS